MLKVVRLGREFRDKVALSDINLTFPDRGFVVIKGESGSGKSTLLNLLSALDRPTRGTVEFNGEPITSENAENYRMQYCGNVFQDYMLLEDLSVRENIELALQACGQAYTSQDAARLSKQVGMPADYLDKKTAKLSGGEKQRVAIARAVVKKHAMIFADEPTGNLDGRNGETVMDLLKEISRERLVVVVSHNEKYNDRYADYTVELEDGVVKQSDLPVDPPQSNSVAVFDAKSKLKPKTLARLAFWGFEKNGAKTFVSMLVFVLLAIFSLLASVAAAGDVNLAYARSLDRCERKNVMIELDVISLAMTYEKLDREWDFNNLYAFRERIDYESCEVYAFNLADSMYREDREEANRIYDLYSRCPYIDKAILYRPQSGVDVSIVCGDFPKEPHDIMLPYCYAAYISKVMIDYKTDRVENLIGKDIVFAESPDYELNKNYCAFRICGIFEEGDYFTDYPDGLDENLCMYYWRTNQLASAVMLAPQAREILFHNAYLFHKTGNDFVKFYDTVSVQGRTIAPYAYDRYGDYAQNYAPLASGEVYMDKRLAESIGVRVGDALTDTRLWRFDFVAKEEFESDFDGMIVKGVFDLADKNDFVIFSAADYFDRIVLDKTPSGFWGYYFNARDIANPYAFFKDIFREGKKLGVFPADLIEYVYTGNVHSAKMLYEFFVGLRYYAFVPIVILTYLGMAAMGVVSFGYLISAKEKSYNVLRALGFGKRSITRLLAVQVFAVILIECALGIALGALCCDLLGKAIVSFDTSAPLAIATECVMPMGYLAPILMTGAMLLLGGAIVLNKTRVLYRRTVMENKTA